MRGKGLSRVNQRETRMEGRYRFQRKFRVPLIKDGGICMLTNLKPEEQAESMEIKGGRGIRQKLSLRGLSQGSIVRVIDSHGPVTIEVDRNIVAIGKGMAQKIRVTRGDINGKKAIRDEIW